MPENSDPIVPVFVQLDDWEAQHALQMWKHVILSFLQERMSFGRLELSLLKRYKITMNLLLLWTTQSDIHSQFMHGG